MATRLTWLYGPTQLTQRALPMMPARVASMPVLLESLHWFTSGIGFFNKTTNSENSGSVGTVKPNNQSGLPTMLGGTAIPAFQSVSIRQEDGADIEAVLPGVNATMDPNPEGFSIRYSALAKVFGASPTVPAWPLLWPRASLP